MVVLSNVISSNNFVWQHYLKSIYRDYESVACPLGFEASLERPISWI